jgi:hypothetical protein
MLAPPFEDFEVLPWPAVVKLKADELLTSWLVRLAFSHLQKVHTFYNIVFRGVQIWNRDIDRRATPTLIKTLSEDTLTSVERIKDSTLNSYEGYLFEECKTNTNTRWILPCKIYHRKHERNSLMYCPQCLRKDKREPYYRKKWRLSMSVVCPTCNCYLYERCFSCGAPVNFHRIELGRRNQIPFFPISTCSNCFAGLDRAPVIKAPDELVKLQKRLYGYLDSGSCDDMKIQYSHLFFNGLRQLVILFSSNREGAVNLNREVSKQLKMRFEKPSGGYKNNFDFLNLNTRAKILLKASWLIDNWPDRFREITAKTKTWSSTLLHDHKDEAPYWFWKEVMNHNYIMFTEWKDYLKGHPRYSSYSSIGMHYLKK